MKHKEWQVLSLKLENVIITTILSYTYYENFHLPLSRLVKWYIIPLLFLVYKDHCAFVFKMSFYCFVRTYLC